MIPDLIRHFGYPVIAAGTFLEGETILVFGGIMAHLGYLEPLPVILCAFAGTVAGDQLYFFIGRYRGRDFIVNHPTWQSGINRISPYLEKHDTLVILAFRFIYGIRTIAPFAIGMTGIPVIRFVLLNMFSAMVWSMAVGGLGYSMGHGVELVMGEMRLAEGAIAVVLVVAVLLFLAGKALRRRFGGGDRHQD